MCSFKWRLKIFYVHVTCIELLFDTSSTKYFMQKQTEILYYFIIYGITNEGVCANKRDTLTINL
jgi:hypothetical protein